MKTPSSLLKRFVRRGGNRGIAVVYIALLLIVLLAFVALAIDIGYMYVAKTQLQNAADAAALAGAARLNGSGFTNQTGARLEAQRFATKNSAAREIVSIDTNSNNISKDNNSTYDGDIILGYWDGSSCNTSLIGNQVVNCVKVTARRTTENAAGISTNNKPVPTFFGKVINFNTINVSSSAIAAVQAARVIPVAANEYWLQLDAAARPYPDSYHEYPSSFLRKTNVDGIASLPFGLTFAVLGASANDNVPASSVPGSKNMNGFVNMDARTSNHDGNGISWYEVITGSSSSVNCATCLLGFNGPVSKNTGSVSSAKFDLNLQYLHEGYPENRILPTAIKEIFRSPTPTYPASNYPIPTSSCPFATVAYFPGSGAQPVNKNYNGKTMDQVYPSGTKLMLLVYDGTFKPDTDPNMPNTVSVVGYSLVQIDGYSSQNPKQLGFTTIGPKSDVGTSGNTAYAHALEDIVEPIAGETCDQFFARVMWLRFKGGKIKLVK